MTLKTAVIGTGQIGYDHIDGFNEHPECEVTAVVDKSEERLKAAADKYGIKNTFTDYKDALKLDDIDIISVALPNALHAPVSLDALNAGKHVFCDKPMAVTYEEACKVKDAAAASGKTFMIGQNFRYRKDTQILKQLAAKGDLGDIYHGRAAMFRQFAIPKFGTWFTRKELAGGGALLDIGVHMLDLLLHLMGSFDAEAVSGSARGMFGPRGIGKGSWGMSDVEEGDIQFDVDDNAFAFIKLAGGKTAILEVTWHAYRPGGQNVYIQGTTGGGTLFPDFEVHIQEGTDEKKVLGVDDTGMEPEYPGKRQVHFVDCVLNSETVPMTPIDESVKVQRILNAIYESTETGREVVFKD